MALFPHGMYIEIESLRLDLHLKTKQTKKNHNDNSNNNSWKYVLIRRKKKKRGCSERTQVAWRPGSSAAWSCAAGSESLHLHFFFFFFSLSFSLFFLPFHVFAFWVINNYYFWIRNRVLETRFPCRCHLEKVQHQMWITHENRVSKTQYIDPKLSFLNSRC